MIKLIKSGFLYVFITLGLTLLSAYVIPVESASFGSTRWYECKCFGKVEDHTINAVGSGGNYLCRGIPYFCQGYSYVGDGDGDFGMLSPNAFLVRVVFIFILVISASILYERIRKKSNH